MNNGFVEEKNQHYLLNLITLFCGLIIESILVLYKLTPKSHCFIVHRALVHFVPPLAATPKFVANF